MNELEILDYTYSYFNAEVSVPKETPMTYVKEYYSTAGIEPNPTTCERLVVEEWEEWVEARPLKSSGHTTNTSKQAELKELADLVFVIYGYALSRGWNLDEALKRVYENNLGRMRQDDGSIKRNEAGKILKNPNAPKVSLEDLV